MTWFRVVGTLSLAQHIDVDVVVEAATESDAVTAAQDEALECAGSHDELNWLDYGPSIVTPRR